MHAGTAAAGTAGAPSAAARAAARRRRVVDDSARPRTTPLRTSTPGRARRRRSQARGGGAAAARQVARAVADDSDDGSWKGGSDSEEDEGAIELSDSDDDGGGRRRRATKPNKKAAKPNKTPAAKPKKGRRGGDSDDEMAEVSGDDGGDADDGSNLGLCQHTDVNEIKQLRRVQRGLYSRLHKLRMPNNPLDDLIQQLGGPTVVAELTGRKGRLVRDASGRTVYAKRNDGEVDAKGRKVTQETINLHERDSFMQGRKLVAIISEAASSGISLQADRRVGNQRKRVHVTLELPWSADQAIQQCGRTHRSNQVQGPEYHLCMTACGGERRFASTVAKRLQALGALTKGDRRAADASDLSAFDVDTSYGRQAMQIVLDKVLNPDFAQTTPPDQHVRQALGIKAGDADAWADYLEQACEECTNMGMTQEKLQVKHFLNRMLGMSIAAQGRVFAHFNAELEYRIEQAKKDDKYDDGVVDMRGEKITFAPGYPLVLASDPLSKVPLHHYKLNLDRGLSYERACEMLDAAANDNPNKQLKYGEGFYISKHKIAGHEQFGHLRKATNNVALLIQTPMPVFADPRVWVPIYKVFRPGTGLGARFSLRNFKGDGLYKMVSTEEIKGPWEALYADSKTICAHGPGCNIKKQGLPCYTGMRLQPNHLVCGAVLPFWAEIEKGLAIRQRMKICRVRVDEDEATGAKDVRLVGIHVQQEAIKKLTDKFVPGAAGGADKKPGGGGGSSSNVKPDVKPKPGGGGGAFGGTWGGGGGASSSSSSGAGKAPADVKPSFDSYAYGGGKGGEGAGVGRQGAGGGEVGAADEAVLQVGAAVAPVVGGVVVDVVAPAVGGVVVGRGVVVVGRGVVVGAAEVRERRHRDGPWAGGRTSVQRQARLRRRVQRRVGPVHDLALRAGRRPLRAPRQGDQPLEVRRGSAARARARRGYVLGGMLKI